MDHPVVMVALEREQVLEPEPGRRHCVCVMRAHGVKNQKNNDEQVGEIRQWPDPMLPTEQSHGDEDQ